MQDKSKFDELLISYLSKELNPEDEAFVLEWINFDEQNRQYFEKLNSLCKLLSAERTAENIDVNYEWKQFKQEIYNRQQNNYFSKKVENTVEEYVTDEKPTAKATIYKIATAVIAASVLLAIALTSDLFDQKPAKLPLARAVKKGDTARAFLVHEQNTSGKPRHLVLTDGSEIVLSDKSEVSYRQPFTGKRRDITLQGRAHFTVAKDKSKPFTVFSGDLSTMALGTRFTVTAFEKGRTIIVRLYEGKVAVKPVVGLKKTLQDFYLLPGQELVYNKALFTATLRKFGVEHTTPANNRNNIAQEQDFPSFPLHEKGSWYMFNNQSLEEVFGLLESMYDVKIVCSKRAVRNKYFIGKFKKTDSVEVIINQIAAVNTLKVKKKDNTFSVSK